MAFNLPPPPQSDDFKGSSWQDWFYKLKAALAGISTGGGGGGSTQAFGTINVPSQASVVADAAPDTLTLVGVGASITTDSVTDTITITTEAPGAVATHAALTTTHGISAFGATLVDDTNASSARVTLGLGGAATLSVGTTAGTVAAGDDSRFGSGGSTQAFGTISVSGQSDVVADAAPDTLTLVGSGATITTNASTDTITITAEAPGAVATHSALTTTHGISAFGATLVDDANATTARSTLGLGGAAVLSVGTTAGTVAAGDDSRFSGGSTLSFGTIAVSGQSDVVADTSPDTLTLVGSGAVITTNAATDTITISAEAPGAVATHAALTTVHGISAFGATLVDDTSATNARTTLGLGGAAVLSVGTTTGTVAAGDDSRFAPDPAETTTTIGALISGATTKTTPVDADSFAISDSAASGILKQLTWASLKTALNGIFARLAGVAGGQTLSGGTAASETLTLQSTAHATKGSVTLLPLTVDQANLRVGLNKTSPAAALHVINTTEPLRLGYDDTNYCSSSVDSSGILTLSSTGGTNKLKGTVLTDNPALSAELLSSAGWTVTAGWTESPDDNFTHAFAGGTTTLTHSLAITTATKYQVSWVMTGRTTGSITVSIGGVSSGISFVSADYGPTTTSTAGFTVTPTNDFNGTVVFSVKTISSITRSFLTFLDSSGAVVGEVRCPSGNLGFGISALGNCTTGVYNLAFGNYTLQNVTSGTYSLAMGSSALRNLTTGAGNFGMGANAFFNLISGNYAIALGFTAGYNFTSASYITCVGGFSGRYQADGSTALASATYSIYLGYNAKGFNDSDNYSIVIGANAAGLGAQTTVLGTLNQTTAATIYGAGTFSMTNSTGNAVATMLTLTKNVTSGVGAAGLGPRIVFAAESSTTLETTQADITSTWLVATHATRTTRLALSAWDYNGAREGIRIDSDGTVARLGFFGAAAVVKPTALTTQLTTLTYTAPGTPDYAIQDFTQTTPYGFVSKDEANSVLAVIKNLQDRVGQLETKLQGLGLLT